VRVEVGEVVHEVPDRPPFLLDAGDPSKAFGAGLLTQVAGPDEAADG
jgi:hypothetical protein